MTTAEQITEETTEVNDTLLTDANETETSVEDKLYSDDQQLDETANETKEETEDSEKEVAQSGEEAESEETEETAGDETEVEYKLELEDNSLYGEEVLEGIEAFARENNLSQDAAQNLVTTQHDLLRNWVSVQMENAEAEKDGWRSEVINDKNMGGDNLKQTIARAKDAVSKFGTAEFEGLLGTTGYGDHPEVVKFFSRVGALLENDSLKKGGEFGGTKSPEEVMYGSN